MFLESGCYKKAVASFSYMQNETDSEGDVVTFYLDTLN